MRIEGYEERDIELKYPLKMDGQEYTKIKLREVSSCDEVELGKVKEAKESIIFSSIFVIHRCIAEVVGAKRLPTLEETGYLPYAEIERIAVALRKMTVGEVFQAAGVCPHCKKPVSYDVTTDDFLVNQDVKFEDVIIPLRRGAVRDGKVLKNAKILPFSGWSLYELQKLAKPEGKDDTDGTDSAEYLSTFIEKFDDVEANMDDIKFLTKFDRNTIRDAISAPSVVKPTLGFVCEECEKDIDLMVWVFDFLY